MVSEGYEAQKKPRVSGAECFGGTSDDRICGTIDK
jgi:hypothetical protein